MSRPTNQGVDSSSYHVDVVENNQLPLQDWIKCEIGKNIEFDIKGLEDYCFSDNNSLVYDVFVVAAAVQFCDHSKRRPASGWSRQFELRVPVHEPDIWNSRNVKGTLHDALDFLTGDQWKIKFKPRKSRVDSSLQQRLPLDKDYRAVIAYSEGLDSLMVSKLEGLEFGDALIRVRLGEGSSSRPTDSNDNLFTLVPFNVNYGQATSVESSSRSRGFRFALLSGVAAFLAGARRVIVPESGQGALGPALIPVGQYYEDYRNHPFFTKIMESFLSAIFDVKIHYDFPRLWSTKGETLKEFVSNEKFDQTKWQQTRSCWQDQRYASVLGRRRQCGVCAACMLRRMSVNSANLTERMENYVWENLSAEYFEDGKAKKAGRPTIAMKEHAVAGILHINNLANFLNSELNRSRFDLHVSQLSQVLELPINEVRSNFECLLRRHEKEWKSFLDSLEPNSFVSKWVKEP